MRNSEREVEGQANLGRRGSDGWKGERGGEGMGMEGRGGRKGKRMREGTEGRGVARKGAGRKDAPQAAAARLRRAFARSQSEDEVREIDRAVV